MRNKQLIDLIAAHYSRDEAKIRIITNEIIQEEEAKNHKNFAEDLRRILDSPNIIDYAERNVISTSRKNVPIPRDDDKGFPLLEIRHQYRGIDDLILKKEVLDEIKLIIAENKSTSSLASYGLKPRQKILFYGEPGTGKTLAAHVMSTMMNVPMVHVRFDSIISSYLGETASNLRKVFNFIENGKWVVLFDEFDFIAKKRDDPYEHGEIKRVVNNFIQMMDSYGGSSLLIASTNHQYLLDVAVWRRFDDAIFFDIPDFNLRKNLFVKYLNPLMKDKKISWMIDDYAMKTDMFSPSDIQNVCENALRRAIINQSLNIVNEDIELAINHQKIRKTLVKRVNSASEERSS